jgi:HAD superfamily hydrolase (TIGR01459 family)
MEFLPGFAGLAERYDGFIVDLWGVVHDGVNPYPGAVDCLTRLRDSGKRVVMLSNAPRRNHAAQASMQRMGIPDDLYTDILTSGEAVYRHLRDRPDPWWQELGIRVFHLGPARDRSVLEGLGLTEVATPAEAAFVLNTGPDDHANPTDMAEFEGVLSACRAAGLRMICGNPDLEVIRDGVRVLCAGSLAVRYQEMGGDVRSLGKPDPAIYAPVFEMLDLPPARAMAVGDSLRTDIAGAAAMGIAACWVLGGLHGDELAGNEIRAQAAASAQGLSPEAVIAGFTW